MKMIPLTKGKIAYVDDDRYEELSKFKWHAKKIGDKYVAARKVSVKHYPREYQQTELMHRRILDSHDTRRVIHRNGNRLDNRLKNLK